MQSLERLSTWRHRRVAVNVSTALRCGDARGMPMEGIRRKLGGVWS